MSFKEYMKVVSILMAPYGVSPYDLADYCWRDAYEFGEDPQDAVYNALENDGFPTALLDIWES